MSLQVKNYWERAFGIGIQKPTEENNEIISKIYSLSQAEDKLDENLNEIFQGLIKCFESKLDDKEANYYTWFADRQLIDAIIISIMQKCVETSRSQIIANLKKLIDIISKVLPITLNKKSYYQCTYYRRLLADFHLILFDISESIDKSLL